MRGRSGRTILFAGIATGQLLSVAADAQEIARTAPLLDPGTDEYKPAGIALGGARLLPSAEARLTYDDNIYAARANRMDDEVFTLSPRLTLDYDRRKLRLTGRMSGDFRRYANHSTENSNAGMAEGVATLKINDNDRLVGALRVQRAVEDRGDPEARENSAIGPRLSNVWGGSLEYSRRGRRIGLAAQAAITRYDFLSALDDERDMTQYVASGRMSVRLRGQASLFGQLFVNRRDYRLRTDFSGVNRDADTYGGRAGIAIDPGGLWRGEAGVGLFRLDPKDPALDARTGFSVSAALIYQPRRRLAFTLDAFRGDVATVRNGATARIDTRLRLGVQQEVRHNLRWQSALVYRKSSFIGAGSERTLGGLFEIEYLLNRRLSLAATARYADRNSSSPIRQFERFRGGLELRWQY